MAAFVNLVGAQHSEVSVRPRQACCSPESTKDSQSRPLVTFVVFAGISIVLQRSPWPSTASLPGSHGRLKAESKQTDIRPGLAEPGRLQLRANDSGSDTGKSSPKSAPQQRAFGICFPDACRYTCRSLHRGLGSNHGFFRHRKLQDPEDGCRDPEIFPVLSCGSRSATAACVQCPAVCQQHVLKVCQMFPSSSTEGMLWPN